MEIMPLSLAILAVLFLLTEYGKRASFRKLSSLLSKGEYDAYFAYLDTPLVKYLYPKYNRLYMKLNGLMFKEDHAQIQKMFDELLSYRITKKQRKDLVLKAFNYYIERGDKKNTKTLLDEIDTWENEDTQKKESHKLYDIFILKKYNYIEEMEAVLDQLSGMNLGFMEYLLSLQYENKGDQEKSKMYLERSQEHMLDVAKQAVDTINEHKGDRKE